MLASICTTLMLGLLLAQAGPSVAPDDTPRRNSGRKSPDATGPVKYYVCGNEQTVSWFIESRYPPEHFGPDKCRPPLRLITIAEEHLEEQRKLGSVTAPPHLYLEEGRMVLKTPEERRHIDEHRRRVNAQKRERRKQLVEQGLLEGRREPPERLPEDRHR